METTNILAVDIGASSGRCILGIYDGKKIELTEIHRFTNSPVLTNGTLYCDILHILKEIKIGIAKVDIPLTSLGVDTWGVDFGLIDKKGKMLGNPVNYRDARTNGIPEEIYKTIPRDLLYEKTGIQPMQINTIFQLYSLLKNNPDLFTLVDKILFTPDLINYFLTGIKATEYSIASTSALLDPYKKDWNYELFDKLGFDKNWFNKEILSTGSILGKVSPEICENCTNQTPNVIATASHDTAAAIAATPLMNRNDAYISCGTWSLVGVETDRPVINDFTREKLLTNERGVDNTVRLLKNLTGLWVLQECKRYWETKGATYDYGAMVKSAGAVAGGKAFIDLNDDIFLAPGNMDERIKTFCKDSEQFVPISKAETVRIIIDSLACHYKCVIDELETATGNKIGNIHIVGGGAKNALLCQITANVTGKVVVAGPVEASSLGNILVQLKALGKVRDMKAGRDIIKSSTVIDEYQPADTEKWSDIYKRFRKIASY